jgi:glutamate formiminotransferase
MIDAVTATGGRVLDVHSDAVHNRSVITLTAESSALPGVLSALAIVASSIDLTKHRGVHPRLGGLDVCPVVPHDDLMEAAVATAHRAGRSIHAATGLPVYFYGAAALRPEASDLPSIRRGGLDELSRRAELDFPPDLGSLPFDPASGVVCVGARDVLIAFNIWLRCPVDQAREIARAVRTSGGGPPGIRSLGLAIDQAPTSQVSMNLIEPAITGIDRAFDAVAQRARRAGVRIVATELVGLLPERYLPDGNAEAARLLIEPGRSIESVL